MARGGSSGIGGGIMGSGIFGFFGTTIQCPASDTSFYCTFMKYFNLFIVFIIIISVLSIIYSFVSNTKMGKKFLR
jgi:hypothetical protein